MPHMMVMVFRYRELQAAGRWSLSFVDFLEQASDHVVVMVGMARLELARRATANGDGQG